MSWDCYPRRLSPNPWPQVKRWVLPVLGWLSLVPLVNEIVPGFG